MSDVRPNPKAARAWLKGVITANQKEMKGFLEDKLDLREEFLNELFMYRSGGLTPAYEGLASLWLLELARTTPAGYNFLRKLIAELVRNRESVPEVWREMHAGILDGSNEQPGINTGRPAVHERRDELLEILIKLLQIKFGLPRLSNDLNLSGNSAIEIVFDELSPYCRSLSMVMPKSVEMSVRRGEIKKSADPILRIINRPTKPTSYL